MSQNVKSGTPDSRELRFQQMFNVRDLGGLASSACRVLHKRVYRADDPHLASDADIAALRALRIDTVIDLRTQDEIAQRGTRWEDLGARRASRPLWAAVPPIAESHRYLDPLRTAELYGEMHDRNLDAHRELWHSIAEASSGRTVIHCASGRDRTGIVVALLLSFLGVDEASILEDYSMSADGMKRMLAYLEQRYPPDELAAKFDLDKQAMVLTPPETIRRYLAWVRDRHGSIEGYAADIGIQQLIPLLRDNLLA